MNEMPLCTRCGVIAPSRASACGWCSAPFGRRDERPAAPSQTEGYWVAVRCSFQCGACAFAAPLDGLDVDGAVDCAQCGLRQKFDVGSWGDALRFAHGIGNLAWPKPDGRTPHPNLALGGANPALTIGVSECARSSPKIVAPDPLRRVDVEAGPGHPVCVRCSIALTARLVRQGVVATSCARCGETAEYALPEMPGSLAGKVAGVVAPEHRVATKAARREPGQGGGVLHCGDCGAPLPPTRERILRCAYCQGVSRIPAGALSREPGEDPKPLTWWLLFQGPSDARRSLEMVPRDEAPLEDAPAQPGRDVVQLAVSTALPIAALVVTLLVAVLIMR